LAAEFGTKLTGNAIVQGYAEMFCQHIDVETTAGK